MNQITEIKDLLNKDHLAADIKLSMFFSAASSFKQDSLLSPFPKNYQTSDGVKNFEKLTANLKKIPSVEELVVLIMSGNVTSVLSDTIIDLVHWILTTPKFRIESVPRDKFDFVLSLPKNSKKSSKPKHIFKITYEDSGLESKFQHIKANSGMDTKFAYHGTRFCNIYSILNYGLQQHKCQTGLFGEGLYFAQELDVSMLFSPSVLAWNLSQCGNTVSCVAVCEYINDPLYVKQRKENAKNSDIPQDYLLITNNELVRVRYLLVYGSIQKSLLKQSATKTENSEILPQRATFSSWCRKNPLIVSVFLYVLMLSLVGLNDHRAVQYYKNIALRFLKNRFKFL